MFLFFSQLYVFIFLSVNSVLYDMGQHFRSLKVRMNIMHTQIKPRLETGRNYARGYLH